MLLFSVVKRHVVWNDNINFLLHGDILCPFRIFFYPGYFSCWCVSRCNTMKAQLECIGFSYHSSHMLIIVCTVGATAIHSSRPERTVCMLQTFKSSGWALRSYSQLVLKRVVKEQYGLELQTGWSFHSVRPAATWCWLELILMSASAYMTKTLFFTPNKLNLSFPKTKLFWNLMKEFFFFSLRHLSISGLMGAMLW